MQKISVVIAAYNEEGNIKELYSKLKSQRLFEIIFIDDGSTDNTYSIMEEIAKKDSSVKIIKFRKNFGQSAAWDAGFKEAKGDIIITMDADLQNDPSDIPKLINELNKGYDVVSGWRWKRKDNLTKRLFSFFSFILRRLLIKDKIHDSGCSLKAYKRECLEDVDLYGEMHRYIVEILSLRGYKIGEVKINHYPRKSGKTKYNFIRLLKGFLDLIMIAFWQKYSARPVHLFGGLGILTSFMGFIIGLYLLYLKFFEHVAIANRPLLMLSVLLVVIGMQFVIFGIMSDIMIRMYYSKRRNYYIEKVYSKESFKDIKNS